MLKRYFKFVLMVFCLFLSCSNDDDGTNPASDFYSGALTSATMDQIFGTWTIYQVGFKDVVTPVPINFADCGRDFMVFSKNEIYTEYLFKTTDCQFDLNKLSWTLNKGVIKISNQNNQFDALVITDVSENEVVMKARLDVDDDGKLDIVFVYLQRYIPVQFDIVSNSFTRNISEESSHLISYTWQPYHDAETFVAYEIYRSAGESCSKDGAVLVKTITDVTISEFTDLTPPGEEQLCYYLKTKIRSGTLGESDLKVLHTYTFEVKPVNLSKPIANNATINLNWEMSDSPYFSHYEISYSNFPNGITGYGQQVVSVAKIYDRTVISFTDEHPPYLKNPVYSLRVSDVFGNTTYPNPEGYKTSWEVDYQPQGLLPMHTVFSFAIDPTEPVVYLYGYESEADYVLKLVRYNYETNTTEAASSHDANTSTDLPIEVITSSNGKELILEQGNELHVYDATSLAFKYGLKPSEVSLLNDFRYTSTGYWVLTDANNIFSYDRNGSDLTLLDSKPHYANHQGSYSYSVFEIENNQLLLGHKNESQSMVYQLNANGMLTYLKTVGLPIKEYGVRQSQYNSAGHFIINFEDRSLYSTLDFSRLGSFSQPFLVSGLSKNGDRIYGTNNDPNWSLNDTSGHTKEAVIFNRNTQQVETVATKGYPLIVFQNANGEVHSISSGLKRIKLSESISYTMDLFIERLEIN